MEGNINGTNKRVILICEHSRPVAREGLALLLNELGSYQVKFCEGRSEEEIKNDKYDLVLRCALSTHEPPATPHCPQPEDFPILLILMSEGWTETDEAIRQAGFKGYLGPGSTLKRLIDAIDTYFQGGFYYHPGPGSEEKIGPLTKRQIQVLNLVGQSITDEEIAHRIGIAEPTVRHHIDMLYEKLHVDRRGQLRGIAEKGGLKPSILHPEQYEAESGLR